MRTAAPQVAQNKAESRQPRQLEPSSSGLVADDLSQLRAMAASSTQQQQLQARAAQAKQSPIVQQHQRRAQLQQHAIQAKFSPSVQLVAEADTALEDGAIQAKSEANQTVLPAQLKAGIESMSGMNLDHVRVHYNSDKPAQLNAHAYAQGSEIHVAPGQEQHLPHEAWHVVQQAQGRVRPTMQMKSGVAVNDEQGLEAEADHMGEQAAGVQLKSDDAAVVQREGTKEDQEAWRVANHVYGNMPLDAGHLTGGILKKIVMYAKYRDAAERKRMTELSSQKAHMIEKNMYGRGKIGAVMRSIDTASRIMHLIGSIASVVALAANIAAFFAPAALPVGAVAGVIALAAHAAMAALQIILIGRNLYRLRGLSEPEKAKILPTLYRDCAKLGFALLGVITGGVGVGSAVASGGLMAQHALHGAEAAAHAGHMIGDAAGESIGTYGMAGTIAYQNEKENQLGMEGRLALPEHHEAAQEAPIADPHPTATIASEMQQDVTSSSSAIVEIDSAAQDAVGGADGLQADAQPLTKLSEVEAQGQQALGGLQSGEDSLVAMPEGNEADLQAKKDKVEKLEDALGLAKVEDAEESAKDGDEQTVQSKSKSDTIASMEQAKTVAQRAGEESPGLLSRAVNWLKRKFSSFKKRAKRAFASLRQKLTELVLKLAGVKNLPLELGDALTEQRSDAKQVMAVAAQGRTAVAEWKAIADQIAEKK